MHSLARLIFCTASHQLWTRENCGLCLMGMENWITPAEWRSPIWRHLLLKVIYCEAQLQVACQKFKWLNRPFKETWHFIFFLEPMCQLPVQLKAPSGGGTLSHPVCWQPGAAAATWWICASERNYWMRGWMTNAKNTVTQLAHCFQMLLS